MSEGSPLALALIKAVTKGDAKKDETSEDDNETSSFVGKDEDNKSLGTEAAGRDMVSALSRDDAKAFVKALNHFLDIRG